MLLQTWLTKPCHNTFLRQKGVRFTLAFRQRNVGRWVCVGIHSTGRNLTRWRTKTEVGLWRWKSSACYHQLQVVTT